MIDVAIVGAAGYTGAELTRLVAGHPDFALAMVTSAAEAGSAVSDLYPALARRRPRLRGARRRRPSPRPRSSRSSPCRTPRRWRSRPRCSRPG